MFYNRTLPQSDHSASLIHIIILSLPCAAFNFLCKERTREREREIFLSKLKRVPLMTWDWLLERGSKAKNRLNCGFAKLRNYPHYLIPFPVFSFYSWITIGWVRGRVSLCPNLPRLIIFFSTPKPALSALVSSFLAQNHKHKS